ncbi:MAG: type II toxin-antitoxin system prevent-host-death family antitoxin [Acidobacteria bacterium]|nr:type II toxin-antitoxin system prevent-host-death family antitoxin [Acidobacteriota bacterium]
MLTMTYSEFRKNLARTLDLVNENHKPVLITRQNGESAVVMSLADFESYDETAYLLASPKNRERLKQAISQVNAGSAHQHDLVAE